MTGPGVAVDVELAARLQFAVAAVTHGVFSATTVGLITVIAVAQTLAHRRDSADLAALAARWVLPYVVVYAFGIVAGMLLELQFGLNWSGLLDRAGNVVGAPLTIETLSTFVVESTLLALWTFGWGVLGPRLHLVAVWGLAATAMLSEFWALVANSFLQDPRGYAVRSGTIVLSDFGALFTGATLWVSLAHVAGASCVVGGTLVAAVGAGRLRRAAPRPEPADVAAVRIGAGVAGIGGVSTVVAGFQSLSYLQRTQPEKAASLAGDSVLRTTVAGALRQRYGAGDWLPPAWLVLPAIAMIVVGSLVVVVAVWSSVSGSEERPLHRSPVLRLLPAAFAGSLVALVCGWVVREVGRQPWVVHGLVSTADAVSGVGAVRSAATLGVVVVLSLATLTSTVVLVRRVVRAVPLTREAPPATDPLAVESLAATR